MSEKRERLVGIRLHYPNFRYMQPPEALAIGEGYLTKTTIVVERATVIDGKRLFGRSLRFRRDNLRPIPYDARTRGWQLSERPEPQGEQK